MIWQNYQLEHTVLKATEALSLWQTERGTIEISKGTLAIPIKLNNQQKGYVFHGNGKLLLDTIVETHEGAIGEPVDKELIEPFLMLGDIEAVQPHLSMVGKEDLAELKYESEQDFIVKAEELSDHFFGRKTRLQCCGDHGGSIFAFPNKNSKFDILIAKGSKIVYKAMDKVFMSNENRVVLKTPKEVILSSDQKSLFVKKQRFL